MTRYRFGAGMSTGPGRVTWSDYRRVGARAVPRFETSYQTQVYKGHQGTGWWVTLTVAADSRGEARILDMFIGSKGRWEEHQSWDEPRASKLRQPRTSVHLSSTLLRDLPMTETARAIIASQTLIRARPEVVIDGEEVAGGEVILDNSGRPWRRLNGEETRQRRILLREQRHTRRPDPDEIAEVMIAAYKDGLSLYAALEDHFHKARKTIEGYVRDAYANASPRLREQLPPPVPGRRKGDTR